MRKLLALAVLALALVLSPLPRSPQPAQAADNAWSQSTCYSPAWWYGVPGQGTYMWASWDPPDSAHIYWIGGTWYQVWAARGYECPQNIYSLGVPYGNAYLFGTGWYLQKFQRGCISATTWRPVNHPEAVYSGGFYYWVQPGIC